MRRILAGSGRSMRLDILAFTVLVVCSTLALYINYKNKQVSESLVVSQSQSRQIVLARAGASSIEWFLKTLRSELWSMNKLPALQTHDLTATRIIFKAFIERYLSEPFLAINLMDEKGIILVAENSMQIKAAEGQNFSDRDYFIAAKDPANRDKVQMSDPFLSRAGMTKGKLVVAITTPVYYHDQFKGIILLITELEGFKEQFVDPLRLDSSNEAYIIDSNNRIISAGINNPLNGRSLTDIARSSGLRNIDEFASRLSPMQGQKEGIIETLGDYRGDDQQDLLMAFRRFNVGGREWVLIISSSKANVLSVLSPFIPFDIFSIILIVSSTFLAGIIFIITKNSSNLQGFKKAMREFHSS